MSSRPELTRSSRARRWARNVRWAWLDLRLGRWMRHSMEGDSK